jgi:hypothetical protein
MALLMFNYAKNKEYFRLIFLLFCISFNKRQVGILIVRSKNNKMIKLIDLIKLAGITMGKFKIHFATGSNPTPLEVFYDGEFKKWQEYQNNRNFECDSILSLIHLGGSDWLFAGIYKVNGVQARSNDEKSWFEYSTSELPGIDHLAGRAVVVFDKAFRASYLKGERYIDALMVKEIKPERQSIGDFPGFNKVSLSLRGLKTVVRQQLQTWKTALSNVSGVYLIADTATGRQYVGSAYGDGGIWQRWCSYAGSGHGGNKELKDLLKEKGNDYALNFLFTILEVTDLNASKEYVASRESHWKDALLTRQYGYNSN